MPLTGVNGVNGLSVQNNARMALVQESVITEYLCYIYTVCNTCLCSVVYTVKGTRSRTRECINGEPGDEVVGGLGCFSKLTEMVESCAIASNVASCESTTATG